MCEDIVLLRMLLVGRIYSLVVIVLVQINVRPIVTMILFVNIVFFFVMVLSIPVIRLVLMRLSPIRMIVSTVHSVNVDEFIVSFVQNLYVDDDPNTYEKQKQCRGEHDPLGVFPLVFLRLTKQMKKENQCYEQKDGKKHKHYIVDLIKVVIGEYGVKLHGLPKHHERNCKNEEGKKG